MTDKSASFDHDYEEISRGHFGLGYAEIVIRVRKPNGKFDEISIHSMLLNSTDNSELIQYEKFDELSPPRPNGIVQRPTDKAMRIVLEGRLLGDENGQLFTVKLNREEGDRS